MKKIFIPLICLFLSSCAVPVYREVIVQGLAPKTSKLTLKMVGDALIHSPIYEDAYEDGNYNFNKMFSEFTSELVGADLLYYNAETILGGKALGYSGYPRFNTPDEFGKTMIDMGFNLVSRANNHTLDKGEAGVLNACNFWNKYPEVLTNGSSCTKDERERIRVLYKNGISYALLSYTTSTNGLRPKNSYYVNVYSDEIVREDIEKLVGTVDVIIVAMHWGNEYSNTPNEEQLKISEYLASLGVNIVIGTHPHVVEPIKWIDKTLVIYSLGNFISSQSPTDSYNRLIGMLASVDIIKTEVNGETSITLSNLNTTLLYSYRDSFNRNYRVIPFNKMDDTILKDYKSYQIKYNSIIKMYDNSIKTN